MFSTLPKTILKFSVKFNVSSVNALSLDQSKNLSFGKELKKKDEVFFISLVLLSSKTLKFEVFFISLVLLSSKTLKFATALLLLKILTSKIDLSQVNPCFYVFAAQVFLKIQCKRRNCL